MAFILSASVVTIFSYPSSFLNKSVIIVLDNEDGVLSPVTLGAEIWDIIIKSTSSSIPDIKGKNSVFLIPSKVCGV